MAGSSFLKKIPLILLVFLNIGCDQVSKNIARKSLDEHKILELAGPNFILTKVENSGAFLGLGSNFHPLVKGFLLLLVPSIVLGLLLIYLISKKELDNTIAIGLTFIIGGGIGNLADRFLYGSVTDFIHIDLYIFKTGIFNLADVSVMTGVVYILYLNIIASKKISLQ